MSGRGSEYTSKSLRFDIDGKINLHTGAMLMPNVARALALPMMSAHGAEFLEIYHNTRKMLQEIMRTKSTILITVGTTTLALDSTIASIVEPGDKVLTVVNGNGIFSNRTLGMVKNCGGKPIVVSSPSDKPVNTADVDRALKKDRDIQTVICAHVESSYGTANPIEQIGEITKENGALFAVDAAPTIGGTDVRVDDWGIDVCVSSSFKGLGGPMGTPIISVSDNAWKKVEKRTTHLPYHSLLRWRKYFVDAEGKSINGDPAPSMAVNNVCALHEATRSIIEDGIEKTFASHRYAAKATRLGVRAMGLEVFPDCSECTNCTHRNKYCSDALTVVKYPSNISEERFRDKLNRKYGVIVSGGLGELRGKVFRIGHMGKPQVLPQTVFAAICGVENTMFELGAKITRGEGAKMAEEVLSELQITD